MALQVPDYIRSLVPYVPGKPIEETQREFNLKRVIKLALGGGNTAVHDVMRLLTKEGRVRHRAVLTHPFVAGARSARGPSEKRRAH